MFMVNIMSVWWSSLYQKNLEFFETRFSHFLSLFVSLFLSSFCFLWSTNSLILCYHYSLIKKPKWTSKKKCCPLVPTYICWVKNSSCLFKVVILLGQERTIEAWCSLALKGYFTYIIAFDVSVIHIHWFWGLGFRAEC
jgi:hypothetical protein